MTEISENPYFYGSAKNRLNSKGQVAMPKRFRAVVPQNQIFHGFVLVKGEGDSIYMYTHAQFSEVKERVREIALGEGDPEFFRSFMEGAVATDIDSQGRFVLPKNLKKEAGIMGPEILFIGMDDRIEVWCPKNRKKSAPDTEKYEERRQSTARRIFGL